MAKNNKEVVLDRLPQYIQKNVEIYSARELDVDYVIHISANKNIKKFVPQISRRTMNTENRSVPRVSTSSHLAGSLAGSQISVFAALRDQDFYKNHRHFIYGLQSDYYVKPNSKLVPDVKFTDEYWLITYNRDTEEFKPSKMGEFFIVTRGESRIGKGIKYNLVIAIKVSRGHKLKLTGDENQYLDSGFYLIELKFIERASRSDLIEIVSSEVYVLDNLSKSEYEDLAKESNISLEEFTTGSNVLLEDW